MARSLVVEIVGDASSLDRAFKKGARSAKGFQGSMRGTTLSVRGFHRSLLGMSSALLGGAGFVVALRSVASETAEMQKVAAQTNAVIKSTGGVAGVSAKDVDTLATSLMNLSGVDDELIKSGENVLLTFTNVRNVMGEGNNIFDQATKAALDLSVRMGQDLQGSIVRVGKALQDPIRGVTALRRVGVNFTKAQEKQIKALVESGRLLEAQKIILRELNVEFGGAAEAAGDTFAGKLSILRETLLNLAGTLATKLLPTLTPLVDRLVAWAQSTENQQRVMWEFQRAVEAVGNVLETLRSVFNKLNDITGSTKDTFKTLLTLFVAFKALKLGAYISTMARQMGLFAAASALAGGGGKAGKVGPARAGAGAAAGGAAGANPWIALAIATVTAGHLLGIDRRTMKLIRRDTAEGPRTVADIIAWGEQRKREEQAMRDAIRTPEPFTRHTAIARRTAAAAKAQAVVIATNAAEVAKRLRSAREATRQEAQERAAFAVERTSATATLTDDLAALNRYNALLLRRIRGGHATLELEREQFQVQQQIADKLREQAEAQKAARQARQFRALGFGPEGQELIPGAAVLKRQAAAVQKLVQGTFLDTGKTRGLLARIGKILSGALGAATADVRAKIQQLLDDLKEQARKSALDIDRFQTAGRGQFVTVGARGGGVVVNGGVHVHGVQNVKQMENELARRTKQRPHSRRVR